MSITKHIFSILTVQWQILIVFAKLRISLDQFEVLTKELVKLFYSTNLFFIFLSKSITVIKIFPFVELGVECLQKDRSKQHWCSN